MENDKETEVKPQPTTQDIEAATQIFFDRYWNRNTLGAEPSWVKTEFPSKGKIPYHDKGGCYAILENCQVVYIGIGISSLIKLTYMGQTSWGINSNRSEFRDLVKDGTLKYQLGNQLEWNVISDNNGLIEFQKGWKGATGLLTIGFEVDHVPLAYALHEYLVFKLLPRDTLDLSLRKRLGDGIAAENTIYAVLPPGKMLDDLVELSRSLGCNLVIRCNEGINERAPYFVAIIDRRVISKKEWLSIEESYARSSENLEACILVDDLPESLYSIFQTTTDEQEERWKVLRIVRLLYQRMNWGDQTERSKVLSSVGVFNSWGEEGAVF